MLFHSYIFAGFFAVFMAAYWLCRRRLRAQNVLILTGSLVFYGWWDERFVVLILVSIVTDFLCGLGASGFRNGVREARKAFAFLWVVSFIVLVIAGAEAAWITKFLLLYTAAMSGCMCALHRLSEVARRKAYLVTSVAINLGILGVFKYFNFFANQIQLLASNLGVEISPITLNLILPVGISFYTFQTLSYTIDAYRGKLQPITKLLELASFVAFFPQLVAGPIERASNLLPQFFRQRNLTLDQFISGVWLFVWGLFKKIVIADNLAVVADAVFSDPSSHASTDLVAALIAFSFQIYCDFSGYSDMARGTARLLGFELMLNFNLPYIARTPSEFWQRWHISLSSWLRDYLYIPMGGNRSGAFGVYRNLVVTMLLGGLWHGANWTFIAWGAYQGLILVVYRLLAVDEWLASSLGSNVLDRFRNAYAVAVMFVLNLFGWLLFRAESLTDVGIFLGRIDDLNVGTAALWAQTLPLIAWLVFMQSIQVCQKRLEILSSSTGVVGLTLRSLVVYGLVFLSARGGQEFIYFDF